jgi:hypothetical protein
VAAFASTLGHLCLNETIRAVLTGTEIPTHIKEYREDHIWRFKRVREAGDADALFVPSELDLDSDVVQDESTTPLMFRRSMAGHL